MQGCPVYRHLLLLYMRCAPLTVIPVSPLPPVLSAMALLAAPFFCGPRLLMYLWSSCVSSWSPLVLGLTRLALPSFLPLPFPGPSYAAVGIAHWVRRCLPACSAV